MASKVDSLNSASISDLDNICDSPPTNTHNSTQIHARCVIHRNTQLRIMASADELKELASLATRMKQLSDGIMEKVDAKVLELKEWEGKRKRTEEQIEENVKRAKSKIVLDVGGKRFSTSKDTLLSQRDTYFSALLQSGNFKPGDEGSYFVDRSPKYFAIILEYLRTGKLSVSHLNSEQMDNLTAELDYYQIHIERLDSKILAGNQASQIEEWTAKKLGALLWRGSEHAFRAEHFHTHCDDKGPTVVVVQSKMGWIFGGYASMSWNSFGGYFGDSRCFLFTLTNPASIPPTKYVRNGNNRSLFGGVDFGPTFGAGDLCLKNDTDTTIHAYSNFPAKYIDTTNHGQKTFAGAQNFTISEVEVFEVK
eukprot:Phypoly_transcript_05172.p1 GENE.Phypoly_transcript_05172~~Phypoly_transcript_05172.p1  ORF type:complete len:365 (+),score=43.73 Phypoly_transcript_05172:909-2003(+)